jgi:hypothetical protein
MVCGHAHVVLIIMKKGLIQIRTYERIVGAVVRKISSL